MGIEQELVWLALHKTLSSRTAVLRKIGELCEGDVGRLVDLTETQIDEKFDEEAAGSIRSAISRLQDAASDWEGIKARGVEVIPFTDRRYPKKLREMSNLAPLIYARGNISIYERVAVGICGSRVASEESLEFARRFGALAADLGLVVVSGVAKGIDTAAHLGTLEAGGTTIFVLAEGIGRFRPKKVFSEVVDFGERVLAISQFYPRHTWQVSRAMTRNRMICGFSEALIVVEAGETGGTIAAGRECIRQGKPLLVVERSSRGKTAPGNQILIGEGGIPMQSWEGLQTSLLEMTGGLPLSDNRTKSQHSPLISRSNQLEGEQLAMSIGP